MPIKSIGFGFMSPKMIKDISAVKIEQAELYDPDGYPIDSGLCDLRLGVVDPGLRCRTCGGTIGQCLGHFGYLELTKPVVHPLYGKKIYMILRSTCQQCSKPMMSDNELKKSKNPLVELYKKKIKTCPHCGEKQKETTFQKPTTYRGGKEELTSEEIRQRLELKELVKGGNIHVIRPYYKNGVFFNTQKIKKYRVVSNLQLYLDLYHFQPRGREHAEYLKKSLKEKGIYLD